jgi:hypothetical protein
MQGELGAELDGALVEIALGSGIQQVRRVRREGVELVELVGHEHLTEARSRGAGCSGSVTAVANRVELRGQLGDASVQA